MRVFTLSKDEFLDVFFEDLKLPNLVKTKLKDMNAADVDAAVRTLAGSARSMGVIVEGV